MAEMYDYVKNNESKRKGKLRKEWKVAALIVAVVIVLGTIGGLLWRKISAGNRFSDFCAELSAATTYAYKHDSATVNNGTETYRLTGENIYEVYQCVCVYGPGDERRSVPEGDSITIDYGNGATLTFVTMDDEDGSKLCFCFSDGDGYKHNFVASGISLQYLNGRYLKREKNE